LSSRIEPSWGRTSRSKKVWSSLAAVMPVSSSGAGAPLSAQRVTI
jgi:hypothetical protein